MGQGLLVGGSGGLPPLNSETVELPAYDADIKPNTFVSIADYQNGFATLALEDGDILKPSSLSSSYRLRDFRLLSIDKTHFLLVSIVDYYVYFKTIKINTNGTCTVLSSTNVSISFDVNTDFVLRASNNRFFVYAKSSSTYQGSNSAYYVSAARITIQVNSDYSITILKSILRTETVSSGTSAKNDGINQISPVGNDLFIVTGTVVKKSSYGSSVSAAYDVKICKLDTSGELVTLYTVDTYATSSSETYYCAGITNDGKAVIVNNYSSNQNYYIRLYTITETAMTRVDSGTNYVPAITSFMIPLGNNTYAILFQGEAIRTYKITDNTITLKQTINTSYGEANEGGFIYDANKECLLVKGNDLLQEVDLTTLAITPLSGSAGIYGTQLVHYENNVYYGISSSPTGIGKFDLATLQECVRDSLDTSVISGLTLTACTKNKAGKVCVLSGSTSTMTSYGLQQNVVNTVIDDSIDAIQEEVQNAMDK